MLECSSIFLCPLLWVIFMSQLKDAIKCYIRFLCPLMIWWHDDVCYLFLDNEQSSDSVLSCIFITNKWLIALLCVLIVLIIPHNSYFRCNSFNVSFNMFNLTMEWKWWNGNDGMESKSKSYTVCPCITDMFSLTIHPN